MDEIKYYCYICDEELTDTNNSDEHIILNSIEDIYIRNNFCVKDVIVN